MLAAARLPMLYSDSLLCSCSLLILQHAEFLLRPIGLSPGNSDLSREIFRASLLRCALVYRHNDIIVLIIGKSNTHTHIYISSSSSSFHYSGATTKVMSLAIICSFNVHAGYIALQHQLSNSPDSPGKAANVIPKEKKGNPQPPHR